MPSEAHAFSGYIELHGANIYAEAKGSGTPLLFIHAGVGDSGMWDAQFEYFAQTHYVIRCDLRGFGRSTTTAVPFTYYNDIAALLEYLHIAQVALVGASFGGAVALDFTIAYPDMVTKLILVAPALGGYRFQSAEMRGFSQAENEALNQHDLESATELNLVMWVDGWNRPVEQINREVRERVRTMQYQIFQNAEQNQAIEEELDPPASERLATIAIPTLVIIGDKDLAEFQSLSQQIAEQIKTATHQIIPDTAHLPSMEQPERFNQLVAEFLG